MIYNFTKKVWKHFLTNAMHEEDFLPSLDSHSMVVDTRLQNENTATIYIVCGFNSQGGVYTNSVYSVDTNSGLSKQIFKGVNTVT